MDLWVEPIGEERDSDHAEDAHHGRHDEEARIAEETVHHGDLYIEGIW